MLRQRRYIFTKLGFTMKKKNNRLVPKCVYKQVLKENEKRLARYYAVYERTYLTISLYRHAKEHFRQF